MVVVTQGRGIWIIGAPFLLMLGVVAIGKVFYSSDPPAWLLLAWPVTSGLACIGLGTHARLQRPWVGTDPLTGKEVSVRPVHSLYWIRAEYWGLAYLALAVWLFTMLDSTASRTVT